MMFSHHITLVSVFDLLQEGIKVYITNVKVTGWV